MSYLSQNEHHRKSSRNMIKSIAAVTLAASLYGCLAGTIEPLQIENLDPDDAAPGSQTTRANYPAEEATRYNQRFSNATSRAVCEPGVIAKLLGSRALRLLTSSSGTHYVLSPSVAGGSFGTIYYARAEDGSTWAVKEFADLDKDMGMFSTDEAALRQELGLWEHVGRDVTVREVLRDEAQRSTFAVLTLLEGDVGNAAPQVSNRVALARGMLKQVAGDAQELHDLGFVHHDMRAPNVLWDPNGRLVLADYGLARYVEADGLLERAPWYVVMRHRVGVGVADMVAAPEVKTARYSAKADTWSLGLTALNTLLPQEELASILGMELMQNSGGFADWRASLLNQAGKINLACVLDPSVQTVPSRYHLFHEVFWVAKQVDSELTQVLLQHLLDPNPDTRWSMAQIVQQVHGPSAAELAPMLRAVAAQNLGRQAMFEVLRACDESLHP